MSSKTKFYLYYTLSFTILSFIVSLQIYNLEYKIFYFILFTLVFFVLHFGLYSISYPRSLNRNYAIKRNFIADVYDIVVRTVKLIGFSLSLSLIYYASIYWFIFIFKMYIYINAHNTNVNILIWFSEFLKYVSIGHGISLVFVLIKYYGLIDYLTIRPKLQYRNRKYILGLRKYPIKNIPLHIRFVSLIGLIVNLRTLIFLVGVIFAYEQREIYIELYIIFLSVFCFILCLPFVNNHYKTKYPLFLSYIGFNTKGDDLIKLAQMAVALGGTTIATYGFGKEIKPIIKAGVKVTEDEINQFGEIRKHNHNTKVAVIDEERANTLHAAKTGIDRDMRERENPVRIIITKNITAKDVQNLVDTHNERLTKQAAQQEADAVAKQVEELKNSKKN